MKKYLGAVLAAVLAAALLCGCEIIPVPQKAPETEPPVESVAMVVTSEDLAGFAEQYPALREADLRGSTCYAAIEDYKASHPEVSVLYTVFLGGTEVQPDVTSLTLTPEDFDFALLETNLQYLHSLKELRFPETTLTLEQIDALRQANPGIDIDYTVNLCGIPCEGAAEDLDLSGVEPSVLLDQAQKLSLFPQLQDIYLMDAEGNTRYTLEDAAALQAQVPQVLLHYSFQLFGKTVSTEDSEIIFKGQQLAKKEGALDTLRMALSILRGCDRFVLDNCGFSNETMAALRDEFRDTTKVVWRIWFGEGGCLTDLKVIRHVYGLYDYNSANLIYCEDAEYVDFGHNEILKQCDFVAGMPHLKAIILSGSMISDLTPFQNCKELEFLEIAYCGYVTDLTPLASCTNLKRLNIAYTKAESLAALDALELEVLVDARSKVGTEEWGRFEALHPDCIVQHTGDAKDDFPYGYPWRYEQNGDPNPYYALLKEKFGYPNPTNTIY